MNAKSTGGLFGRCVIVFGCAGTICSRTIEFFLGSNKTRLVSSSVEQFPSSVIFQRDYFRAFFLECQSEFFPILLAARICLLCFEINVTVFMKTNDSPLIFITACNIISYNAMHLALYISVCMYVNATCQRLIHFKYITWGREGINLNVYRLFSEQV